MLSVLDLNENDDMGIVTTGKEVGREVTSADEPCGGCGLWLGILGLQALQASRLKLGLNMNDSPRLIGNREHRV